MGPLDRRRHQRVDVNLPISMEVLISEENTRVEADNAAITDLNERGAMVEAFLTDHVYRGLLKKPRYCFIGFKGNPELPDKVVGKAVWIQPLTMSEKSLYRVGIFFENCPEQTVRKFLGFLERSGQAAPAPHDEAPPAP